VFWATMYLFSMLVCHSAATLVVWLVYLSFRNHFAPAFVWPLTVVLLPLLLVLSLWQTWYEHCFPFDGCSKNRDAETMP